MRHRVIKSGGNFYPQVEWNEKGKEGWTFYQFEGTVIRYSNMESAIKYCESQKSEVVWEEEVDV